MSCRSRQAALFGLARVSFLSTAVEASLAEPCLGRKPTAFEKSEEVGRLATEGMNPTDIGRSASDASVYRILGAEPEHAIKMTNRFKKWPKGKLA